MYNDDTDMLFPSRVIPLLRDLRGEKWDSLIDKVQDQPPDALDHLGFVLMMIKLGGCTSCHADSYRAMRGCSSCAQQTIRRFRGEDGELQNKFSAARTEMETYLDQQQDS
jgi:hypothetical protein